MMLTDDQKLATFEAYATATRSGDGPAFLALCSPDAVLWHNFDEAEVTGPGLTAGRVWLDRVLPGAQWVEDDVLLTATGFVWRSVVAGSSNDGPVRVPACAVVTLDGDGRVARIDEYLDLDPLRRLAATR